MRLKDAKGKYGISSTYYYRLKLKANGDEQVFDALLKAYGAKKSIPANEKDTEVNVPVEPISKNEKDTEVSEPVESIPVNEKDAEISEPVFESESK